MTCIVIMLSATRTDPYRESHYYVYSYSPSVSNDCHACENFNAKN